MPLPQKALDLLLNPNDNQSNNQFCNEDGSSQQPFDFYNDEDEDIFLIEEDDLLEID